MSQGKTELWISFTQCCMQKVVPRNHYNYTLQPGLGFTTCFGVREPSCIRASECANKIVDAQTDLFSNYETAFECFSESFDERLRKYF